MVVAVWGPGQDLKRPECASEPLAGPFDRGSAFYHIQMNNLTFAHVRPLVLIIKECPLSTAIISMVNSRRHLPSL